MALDGPLRRVETWPTSLKAEGSMSRPDRRRAERHAGAFLSPVGLVPVPMRNLSDDLGDVATEPEPEREPTIAAPGRLRRAVDRLPPPWGARWLRVEAHIGWVIALGAVGLYLLLVTLRGPSTP